MLLVPQTATATCRVFRLLVLRLCLYVRSRYNIYMVETIFRLVACSGILVHVGIKVRAKTQPNL